METTGWLVRGIESIGCLNVSRQAAVSSDTLPRMASTLAERMQWILANKQRPGGGAWDAKGLSLASALAPSAPRPENAKALIF